MTSAACNCTVTTTQTVTVNLPSAAIVYHKHGMCRRTDHIDGYNTGYVSLSLEFRRHLYIYIEPNNHACVEWHLQIHHYINSNRCQWIVQLLQRYYYCCASTRIDHYPRYTYLSRWHGNTCCNRCWIYQYTFIIMLGTGSNRSG